MIAKRLAKSSRDQQVSASSRKMKMKTVDTTKRDNISILLRLLTSKDAHFYHPPIQAQKTISSECAGRLNIVFVYCETSYIS